MDTNNLPIETHPFPPFLPEDARVLIMGTFPPKPLRWSMDFYYPNKTNDFWRIMGIIFYEDPEHFRDTRTGGFLRDDIERFLVEKGIALHDTGREVRRLRDNASDKFLEIVTPVPLFDLLGKMPRCHAIATTGEKAAEVIAGLTGTEVPKMGERVVTPDGLSIWRMPSTSRAYPLAPARKAEYYASLFRAVGILAD